MLNVNGFFGHIQRNHLRSLLMFFGFAIACQLIGIAGLVGPLVIFDRAHEPVSAFPAYVERYALGVFAVSSILFFFRFFMYVKYVRNSADFKLVTITQEPRLCRIIELQAIAAGVAMPDVGIIEDEARNAFACGLSQNSAVLVVTRGLLKALDDDELEAVVAHEITHIVNGDMQLMAVVNVMLDTFFVLKRLNPFQFSNLKYLVLIFFAYVGIMNYLRGPGLDVLIQLAPTVLFSFFAIFMILVVVSGFIASIGMTFAKLSRLLITSSREFIADAEAVRMTKNPAALISALKRIDGRSRIEGLDDTIDAMMIDGAVEGAFASHPTIADRVAALARHAGAMVHATGRRKDTRKFEATAARPSTQFSKQFVPAKNAGKKPKWLLVDRVNAGSGENAFGLTPRTRNLAIIGILITIVFWQQLNQMQTDSMVMLEKKFPERTAEINAARAAKGSKKGIKKYTVNLMAVHPLLARCFATKDYKLDTRYISSFKKPDKSVVSDLVNGGQRADASELDKYAAIHTKTQLDIANAPNETARNKALMIYVRWRVIVLRNSHQFFGTNGLDWFRKAYESPRDQQIVDMIRTRLKQGIVFGKSERETSGISLLIDNSSDFIPCHARAILGPARPTQIIKVKNSQSVLRLVPMAPMIKTTLRGTN